MTNYKPEIQRPILLLKHGFSIVLYMFLLYGATACKPKVAIDSMEQIPESRTPVTVTNVETGKLSDVVMLNATSSFLMKTFIKATTNGYLQEVNIKPGDRVTKGQKLFTIRLKEAEHLGNTVNEVDSSFHFKGSNQILAPVSGYITELNLLQGNYVQEGETLAAISDLNSLVFLLDLPYELKPYLSFNKTVDLLLPDGKELKGEIFKSMPTVDIVSQTQTFIVKINSEQPIPENLIAKLKYIRNVKTNAVSLPKEAILSNEVQSEFWIMKMADSITAVKIPVVKGIETHDRVEIVSPPLKPTDKVLLTGNYGLPDTVRVFIEK